MRNLVTILLNSRAKMQPGHVEKETNNAHGVCVRERPGKRPTEDKKNNRKNNKYGKWRKRNKY
jgi:hypothetical protein